MLGAKILNPNFDSNLEIKFVLYRCYHRCCIVGHLLALREVIV